jgi:multidrug transporter EmrE-like cation transporter
MSKSPDADSSIRPDRQPAMLNATLPGQESQTRAAKHPELEETSRRHHLTLASTALLLFAVISAATGQVMLKHGMQVASARATSSGGSLVMSAVTSPWVLTGLVVFGISAIAWLGALSKVPLSIAYPFNAIGYLVILTASIVILHERANLLTWAGSILVVSGVIIVVLSRP